MLKRKKVRDRGKIKFSRYFQKLKQGDKVSVVRELAVPSAVPKTIQGRTGIIEGKKGKSYVIKISLGKEKTYVIHPVHLKKLVH